MTTQELAVISKSPSEMMMAAIDKGADLDKLEKLMQLQERWEANNARKAYHEAMTAFKSNPPEIEKDKKVSYGQTHYNHASLSNVTNKINSALSDHGLSVSWTTKQEGNGVTVTCRISHVLGHYEETSLTAELDTSGAKNKIQALGSTVSYLERYSVLALCGLATQEMDNDGQGEIKYIDDNQQSTINGIIEDKKVELPKFIKFMGADSVAEIKAADYRKAIEALKAAQGKK